ncbi:MAG: hypothetical protein ACJAQT_002686 [Akkermansiaceae bacterium]|jgi:hypothetical protein
MRRHSPLHFSRNAASFLAGLLLLLLLQISPAAIIGIENFDYSGEINGKNGGRYWDWDNSTTPGSDTGTSSNWDAVTGAPSVYPKKLMTDSTSVKREYNGLTSRSSIP